MMAAALQMSPMKETPRAIRDEALEYLPKI
jgi:hypothetical protein